MGRAEEEALLQEDASTQSCFWVFQAPSPLCTRPLSCLFPPPLLTCLLLFPLLSVFLLLPIPNPLANPVSHSSKVSSESVHFLPP